MLTKRDELVGRVAQVAIAQVVIIGANRAHVGETDKLLAKQALEAITKWSDYLHKHL